MSSRCARVRILDVAAAVVARGTAHGVHYMGHCTSTANRVESTLRVATRISVREISYVLVIAYEFLHGRWGVAFAQVQVARFVVQCWIAWEACCMRIGRR